MNTTFTKKLLLTGTAIVAVSCIGMGQAHAQQYISDPAPATTAVTTADGAGGGIRFEADGIGTVADGVDIGGDVTTQDPNTGTLNFAGNSTVSGVIGEPSPKLKGITVEGASGTIVNITGAANIGTVGITNGGTATFGSGSSNLDAITFTNGGTVNGGGVIVSTGTVTNTAGTSKIENQANLTTVVVNGGTLELEHASSSIGTSATINAGTLDFKGGTLAANVSGAGTLALSGTQAVAGTITATNVTTNGSTIQTGGGTIGNGSTTLTNTGTSTIGNVVTVGNVAVSSGSLNLSNAGSTIATGATLGSGSTLTFGGTALDGTVTGAGGTLALSNTTAQTVTGAVGTSGAKLNTVSTANTTGTTEFMNGVNSDTLTIAAGGSISVRGNSDITSLINLGSGGDLTVGNGAKFTATAGVAGGDELNLQDASGASFGAASTFNTINKTGLGISTVDGAGAVTATTANIAAGGTLQKDDSALIVTGTTTLTDTGSLTLGANGNTLATLNKDGAASATLGGTGTTAVTTLNVNAGTLNVTNANTNVTTANLGTGTTLSFAGSNIGTVTVTGPGSTLALTSGNTTVGQVGSSGNALSVVNVGSGTKTFGTELHAGSLSFSGTGTADLTATTNAAGQNITFNTNGTVIFGTGVTYTGIIAGAAGAGNLTFGDNATTGSTLDVANALNNVTFAGGTNTINGSIRANTINLGTGTTDVTNGITLRGNVTAGATNVLNVSSKTLNVAGDFTTTSGQQLRYSVNSPATTGLVDATGNINIVSGTRVNMDVDTGIVVTQGQAFTLVQGATGTVADISAGLTTTNTALLRFKQDTSATTNRLVVIADRVQMNSAVKNPNSASVGAMLDKIGASGDADVDALQVRLQNIPTGDTAQIEAILSTLVPDLSGGAAASTVNTSNSTSTIVNNRVASTRSGDNSYGTGVSSGNALQSGHVWAQGFGGTADQGRRDGVAGYDADTYGMVFGVDTDITDSIRAGIALAYANSDVNSKNASRTDTDIDSYQVSLYGDMDLSNNYFVSGQLAYLYNDIDTTRYNVGGLAGNTARADFHSNQYVARAELGRNFAMDHGITLTPSALVHYNYVDTSSYTESGAGGLGLSNVNSDDMQILEFGVNMIGSADFNDGHGGLVTPNLHAGYRYDVIGDSVATTAGLVGAGNAAFNTEGFDPSQHTVNVGTGIQWTTANNLDLSINYDYEYKTDYDAHSGYIRAGFKF